MLSYQFKKKKEREMERKQMNFLFSKMCLHADCPTLKRRKYTCRKRHMTLTNKKHAFLQRIISIQSNVN